MGLWGTIGKWGNRALNVANLAALTPEAINRGRRAYKGMWAAQTFSPSTGAPRVMTNNLMSKVAEERPDVVDYMLRTRDEVLNSPYRDEILGEIQTLVKEAEVDWKGVAKSTAKNLGSGAALFGGALATAIAADLASDLYHAIKSGLSRSKNFKNMVATNPDLKKHNPKDVKAIFDTLHHVAPELASNPTIAGSFVKNQLDYAGGIDVQTLQSLSSTEKNVNQARGLRLDTGIASAVAKDNTSELKARLKKLQRENDKLRTENENFYNKINVKGRKK